MPTPKAQLDELTYPEWPRPYHSASCVCDRCLALDLAGGTWCYWRHYNFPSLDAYVTEHEVARMVERLHEERAGCQLEVAP